MAEGYPGNPADKGHSTSIVGANLHSAAAGPRNADAGSLVQKKPFFIGQTDVNGKASLPPTETISKSVLDKKREGIAENVINDYSSCAIEVQIPAGLTVTSLKTFFENRTLSGGDAVEDLYHDMEGGRLIITFSAIEVVQRVIQKQPLTLSDRRLDIRMLPPAPPAPHVTELVDMDKMFVSNIEHDVQQKDLESYLHNPVKFIVFKRDREQALVEFDTIPDFEEISKRVRLNPLHGRMLRVGKVPFPDTIQIHGIGNIQEYALANYFGDEERSGGRGIKNTEFHTNEQYAKITFYNTKVLSKILRRKHSLQGHELQVSRFYECLGVIFPAQDACKVSARKHLVVQVEDTDPDILEFLSEHKQNEVAEVLHRVHCEISWSQISKGIVELIGKSHDQQKDSWQEGVQQAWNRDIKNMYSKDVVVTTRQIWDEFLCQIQHILNVPTSRAKIKIESSNCSINIVGVEQTVAKVAQNLRDEKLQIEKAFVGRQSRAVERVNMKSHQLAMLRVVQYIREEQDILPDIHIEMKDREIVFRGSTLDIQQAKLHMSDYMDIMESANYTELPKSVRDLLSKDAIKSHLRDHFKSNMIRMVWEIKNDTLVGWALDNRDIQMGFENIRNEIVEMQILLQGHCDAVQTPEWQNLRDTLLGQYGNTLVINVHPEAQCIIVASVAKRCHLVVKDIEKFIAESAVKVSSIVVDRCTYRFVKEEMARDIGQIISEMKPTTVDITQRAEASKFYIVVQGDKLGTAKKKVRALIDRITSRVHGIDMQGVSDYLTSEYGQAFVAEAEHRHSVTVELLTDDVTDNLYGITNHSESWDHSRKMDLLIENLALQLAFGDITDETTEAIVNSTNHTIDLTRGGVAMALAMKGGPSFVTACRNTVLEQSVAMTTGGNLRVKYVIHVDAKTDDWNKVITRALEEADNHGVESIAFPALGTGNMALPAATMARTMLDVISRFARQNPVNVKMVRIIIYPEDTDAFEVFRTEMTRYLGTAAKSLWGALKSGFSNLLRCDNKPPLDGAAAPAIHQSAHVRKNKLRICARNDGNIFAALEDIRAIGQRILDRTGDQTRIARATDMQIAQIQSLEEKYKVNIDITPSNERILIAGPIAELSRVAAEVHALLDNPFKDQYEKANLPRAEKVGKPNIHKRERVVDHRHWEEVPVFDKSDVGRGHSSCSHSSWESNTWPRKHRPESMERKLMEPTPTHSKTSATHAVNHSMCVGKVRETEIRDSDPMEADRWKTSQPLDEKTVLDHSEGRLEVITSEKNVEAADFRSDWTPFDESQDFTLVEVSSDQSQYTKIENELISMGARNIEIQRLQNPTLYKMYAIHKSNMKDQHGKVEHDIWHGTKAEDVARINRYGFNRSLHGNDGSLGDGVYFANNVDNCIRHNIVFNQNTGRKHLYLCKVLTGVYARGRQGLVVPPVRSGKVLYDSAVDDEHNPSVFVIFNDSQSYPMYLVTYT